VTTKRGPAHGTEDLPLRFGDVIRESRHRLGISQEELGWRAGLHRISVTDVERGVRNISIRSIASLAHALDASVSSLFARATELPAGTRPKSRRAEVIGLNGQRFDGIGRSGIGHDGAGVDGHGKDASDLGKPVT
jgi:transcriptional regulator with XRE-family HTH domain